MNVKPTGRPTLQEEKRQARGAPVGTALPLVPMAEGARMVVKPGTDSLDVVRVKGELRATPHVNPNYIPYVELDGVGNLNLPKGQFYGDGEKRIVKDYPGAGDRTLIVFERTGVEVDAGQWWIVASALAGSIVPW